ncbi:MAG: hypothetical protein ACKVOR_02940 [Flavobacteriales bacterium]
MKTILAFCFILFTNVLVTAQADKFAQQLVTTPSIAFETQQITFSEATRPALTYLVHADDDDLLKDWKKFIETKYMIEGKRLAGWNACKAVRIADWSTDTLSIYFKTEKDADASRMYLLIEKSGKFLTDTDDAEMFAKVKATLKQHAKDFYLKQYEMHIAHQQRHYDEQVRDMEKLRKHEEKLNGSIADHNNAKQKLDESIRTNGAKLTESRNEVNALNSSLEQNKKAVDQAEKEASAQSDLIKTKETEYSKLNSTGALNTKQGEKVMKDLEKLRSKMEKLQENMTDANEAQTKTENEIIKAEQGEAKLQMRMAELNADIDKHNADINADKADLDATTSDMRDKQMKIDQAKVMLEKLQAAKAGLAAL